MAQKKNIRSFRDAWLADFLSIQRHIERSLLKSIPRYHESWTSLMLPLLIGIYVSPGNRYEELSGKLQEYSSIRVNKQYRLIFKWVNGKAEELFLDPHNY